MALKHPVRIIEMLFTLRPSSILQYLFPIPITHGFRSDYFTPHPRSRALHVYDAVEAQRMSTLILGRYPAHIRVVPACIFAFP
jgi:hypothetical protein